VCELCDGDELTSCQDCGRTICFDNEPSNVDVVDQAYVTSSGDLFCRRCGTQYDIVDEEGYEDDYFPYPDVLDWDDDD
jgi:uncharacterized protein YbaR (Trm112 family)